jgi:7-cyano-7-deazaguanine synthase
MKPKSIILLSGGLDSTVSATIAQQRTQPLLAITIDYGQRAAKMEIESSRKICQLLKIRHKVVSLPFFRDFSNLVLLLGKKADSRQFNKIENVWVPNRNALFINIAACYAEYHGAHVIATGFNQEEAQEFPDNSERFLQAINRCLAHSTLKRVEVKSYVLRKTKKEIYKLGIRYKAPLDHIYSCYLGGRKMCGKCASCIKLIEARK